VLLPQIDSPAYSRQFSSRSGFPEDQG
jgi:hypothetical protein